jgi:hypothetical protein
MPKKTVTVKFRKRSKVKYVVVEQWSRPVKTAGLSHTNTATKLTGAGTTVVATEDKKKGHWSADITPVPPGAGYHLLLRIVGYDKNPSSPNANVVAMVSTAPRLCL